MMHILYFSLFLTTGATVFSSLRILNQPVNCSQMGLLGCKIKNCSDDFMIKELAPTGPERVSERVGVAVDNTEIVPVMKVLWQLKSDASTLELHGTHISIREEKTNKSICVQFYYNISQQLNRNEAWTFYLNEVAVQPKHTYLVSLINLPEPADRNKRIENRVTIPGCNDQRSTIKRAQICVENGSLWTPGVKTTTFVENKKLCVFVRFQTAPYSDVYRVAIQTHGRQHSRNISRLSDTSLNVTFEFDLWWLRQCEMTLTIQPFFARCKNNCKIHEETVDGCILYQPRTLIIKLVLALLITGGLLYLICRASLKVSVNTFPSTAKEQPHSLQVKLRKRVLVIYSLDHPLYKNVVLKFCGFLATKCGTEVILDLLDSARLGVFGSVQWLDWHREQIERSSDKILVLCSPGVQAKWRAMCGDKHVLLKEDVHSPVGDMLTPALCLLVPQFIRSTSFEKYIVAYFDGICSENDVPVPFNITVRYKLMKQFEELFFRILDTEKQEPGRMNHIEGLPENEYHRCPSGRALRDAVEAFRAHQLRHPRWFEDQFVESSEL